MQPQILTRETSEPGTTTEVQPDIMAEHIAGCRLQMELDAELRAFERKLRRIALGLSVRDFALLHQQYEEVWHDILYGEWPNEL